MNKAEMYYQTIMTIDQNEEIPLHQLVKQIIDSNMKANYKEKKFSNNANQQEENISENPIEDIATKLWLNDIGLNKQHKNDLINEFKFQIQLLLGVINITFIEKDCIKTTIEGSDDQKDINFNLGKLLDPEKLSAVYFLSQQSFIDDLKKCITNQNSISKHIANVLIPLSLDLPCNKDQRLRDKEVINKWKGIWANLKNQDHLDDCLVITQTKGPFKIHQNRLSLIIDSSPQSPNPWDDNYEYYEPENIYLRHNNPQIQTNISEDSLIESHNIISKKVIKAQSLWRKCSAKKAYEKKVQEKKIESLTYSQRLGMQYGLTLEQVYQKDWFTEIYAKAAKLGLPYELYEPLSTPDTRRIVNLLNILHIKELNGNYPEGTYRRTIENLNIYQQSAEIINIIQRAILGEISNEQTSLNNLNTNTTDDNYNTVGGAVRDNGFAIWYEPDDFQPNTYVRNDANRNPNNTNNDTPVVINL